MNEEEKLKFKFDYDKRLDDVFFTNEFKRYIVGKHRYCPDGLTVNTSITGDTPCFVVCTKKYGYEYSGERVPGDYYDLKYDIDHDIADSVMDYLYDTNPDLYHEIFRYEVMG